jgi:hypothetical protein
MSADDDKPMDQEDHTAAVANSQPAAVVQAPVEGAPPITTDATTYRTLADLLTLYPTLKALQTSGGALKGAEAMLLIRHYDLEVNKYVNEDLQHHGVTYGEGTIRDPKEFDPEKAYNNGIFGAYGPRGVHSGESQWRNYKTNSGLAVEAYWHFDLAFPDDADVCFQSQNKIKASAVTLSNQRRVADVERFWDNHERALADIKKYRGCVRQTPNKPQYLFPQLRLAADLTGQALGGMSIFVKLHAFLNGNRDQLNEEDIASLPRAARCMLYSEKPSLLMEVSEYDLELITVAVAADPAMLQWADAFSDALIKNAMVFSAEKACFALTHEPRLKEKVKYLSPDVLKCAKIGGLQTEGVADILGAFLTAGESVSNQHLKLIYENWRGGARRFTRILCNPANRLPMAAFEQLFEETPGLRALPGIAQAFRELQDEGDAAMADYRVAEKHVVAAMRAHPGVLMHEHGKALDISPGLWEMALAHRGTLWTCLPEHMQQDERIMWIALKQAPAIVLPLLPEAMRARDDVRDWAIAAAPDLAVHCPGASPQQLLAAVEAAPEAALAIQGLTLELAKAALRGDPSLLCELFKDDVPPSAWQRELALEQPTLALVEPDAFPYLLLPEAADVVSRVMDYAITQGWAAVDRLLESSVPHFRAPLCIEKIVAVYPRQASTSGRVGSNCTEDQWNGGIVQRIIRECADAVALVAAVQNMCIPVKYQESTWTALVKHDPDIVRLCWTPSEAVQRLAVSLKPSSVRHLRAPSDTVAFIALVQDHTCKRLIQHHNGEAALNSLADIARATIVGKTRARDDDPEQPASRGDTDMDIDAGAGARTTSEAASDVASPAKKHKTTR